MIPKTNNPMKDTKNKVVISIIFTFVFTILSLLLLNVNFTSAIWGSYYKMCFRRPSLSSWGSETCLIINKPINWQVLIRHYGQ